MATWIDFKELRSKLRFVDLLRHYHVELKVKGDRATGFCPLPGHQRQGRGKRRSPSFSVHLVKGIFRCFSCGSGGNVLDFGCIMEGLNPNEPDQLRKGALKLQEVFGLSEAKSPPERMPACSGPRTEATEAKADDDGKSSLPVVVNAPLDFELKQLDPTHEYLASRGLTPETVEHFGLGYCAKGMMGDRIAIPLHDVAGTLIGYAGRLVDDDMIGDEAPKYLFPGARERKGVRHEFHKGEFLYNGHRIAKPVDDLVVVEGFPSVWWLWQNDYQHVVALMGSSCSEKQAHLIVDLVPADGKVLLMPDGDDAGRLCARSLLEQVSPHRFVRWLKLAECEQPTDLLLQELAAMFMI